jgi:hypothetical protein
VHESALYTLDLCEPPKNKDQSPMLSVEDVTALDSRCIDALPFSSMQNMISVVAYVRPSYLLEPPETGLR